MTDIVGFDWDRANRDKCQSHGVSLAEIEAVFHGTLSVFPDPFHSHREERFHAIGKTASGRSVFVTFTWRQRGHDTLIRPISARYMHRKEVLHYEKEIAKTKNR